MNKPIYILIMFLIISSCNLKKNEKEKFDTSDIETTVKEGNHKNDKIEEKIENESIILNTIKENEKTANQLKMLVELDEESKKRLFKFLHVNSINNKPIEYYLNHSEINELVVEFYNGGFRPSDNSKTFEILKILPEKQDSLYPFYFHCLNSIVKDSDGALSEIMGEPCLKMIYNYPKYTFDYFITHSEMFKKYVGLMGYELYFQSYGTSNIELNEEDFFNHLEEILDLNDEKINYLYNDLIEGIEQVKGNMEN